MKTTTKTRTEYLKGNCTHSEYYAQFVDDRVKNIVLNRFTKEELTKAHELDQHLNSIKLAAWDSLAQNIRYKATEVKETGDYLTLAGSVCILKEAARQIVNT